MQVSKGDEALAEYYDVDCPAPDDASAPENFDERAVEMGLAHDVPYYVGLARSCGSPVLDLGAGTGRVAVPMARVGLTVIAVDSSKAMLKRLEDKLARERAHVRARVHLMNGDMASLDASGGAALAVLAFGGLNCIPDFSAQQRALEAIAQRLRPGGLIALDVQNPLLLAPGGDGSPRLVHLRKNPATGRSVARYAMFSGPDAEQRVLMRGFYEEGPLRRDYEIRLRMIHRFELELMLANAGFDCLTVSGGPSGEPYATTSRRIYVVGRRRGAEGPSASNALPSDESLVGVAATALATAAARAAETRREDRLFADPLSRRLAGHRGARLLAELGGAATAAAVAARTAWVDRELLALIADGAKNIVSIGAGLDTRPYRLSCADDTLWIEVDLDEVIRYKDRLLSDQASPRVARIALPPSGELDDAAIDDVIAKLGGDPSSRRVTILEGVLPYLHRSRALRHLQRVARHSAGSAALFDVGTPESQEQDADGLHRIGAPITLATTDAAALATEAGLDSVVTYLGAAGAHFGRLPGPPGDPHHPPRRTTFLVRAWRSRAS